MVATVRARSSPSITESTNGSYAARAATEPLRAAAPSTHAPLPDQPTRQTGSPMLSTNAVTSSSRRAGEWSGLSPDSPRPRVLGR
jgi:hypothetical protein